MPETNPIPIETRDRQRRASDPARSAFVFANAGSGKTHVLASRVTRLMLEGADPGRLLCLTYTRAAAAEMARRVLTTLARWAVAGEGALADEIEALSGLPPAPAMLRRARGLFAHALDTPGGLKVQTIHAFAERLLHAFPLEADVAAAFSLLSEDEEERLRREACDRALLAGLSGRDASLTSAARVLLAALSDDGLAEHLKTLSGKAEILAPYLGEDGPARFAAACRAYLGLEPGREAEAVSRDMAQSPFLAASVLAAVRRAV
ncbi:MAG: UvrD-helicase domain-containing protein, partial [Hyphomicrobiaceae bacterium]|nr:UvrD-helicase domain-containing protein [Hyphomicrobiaceae bacterium]